MCYSRADRESVYRSPDCRRLFTLHENAALRKQKPIRALVIRHNLRVSDFSTDKTVRILQHLLKERVFESHIVARAAFPGLFRRPVTPSVDLRASLSQRTPTMEQWMVTLDS